MLQGEQAKKGVRMFMQLVGRLAHAAGLQGPQNLVALGVIDPSQLEPDTAPQGASAKNGGGAQPQAASLVSSLSSWLSSKIPFSGPPALSGPSSSTPALGAAPTQDPPTTTTTPAAAASADVDDPSIQEAPERLIQDWLSLYARRQELLDDMQQRNLIVNDVAHDGHCQYHAFREGARAAGYRHVWRTVDDLRWEVLGGGSGFLVGRAIDC